jgi:sugar O-acyltransferase (sialic acid O-acetyltransferase NeuD family)
MKPLFIFGAGGLGREILSLVNASGEWEVKGFLDDNKPKNSLVKGVPVLGGIADISPEMAVILAIGDPQAKRKIIEKIRHPISSPVLVHPSAIIQESATVTLGAGTIVCAGTILTCDIRVGNHVLLNLNCTVGHDTLIKEFTSVMPGTNIAGEVTVGAGVLLGSDCNIRNGVVIADDARIGMGTVVLRNVNKGETVVGVPGRVR